MARVDPYLAQRARQLGMDPRAVLAVVAGEGGFVNRRNDRGDGGRSFGPTQMFEEGALPRRFVGRPNQADAWAWSPAGMDYALGLMAKHARGLKGREAIEAMVKGYERPRDPDKSIKNAVAYYGRGAQGHMNYIDRFPGAKPSFVSADNRKEYSDFFRAKVRAYVSGEPEPTVRDLLDRIRSSDEPGRLSAPSVVTRGTPSPSFTAEGYALPLPKGSWKKGGGAESHGSRALGNWQSDRAVDLMAPAGTPVYAVSGGQIRGGFGMSSGKGTVVGARINIYGPGGGYFYQHMAPRFAPGIKPGAKVRKGQLLGWVGNYGKRIGGNHLHLGIQRGDPFGFLGG